MGARTNIRRTDLRGILVAALLSCSTHALARADDLRTQHAFKIQAQSLDTALFAFSDQAKVQVLMWASVQPNARSAGATGDLSAAEALKAILVNTGLAYEEVRNDTVAIVSATSPKAGVRGESADRTAAGPDKSAWRLAQSDNASAVRGESARPTDTLSADSNKLSEIVVTATRRSLDIQKTPMTISAFNAEALLKSGAVDTRGLQSQVPGLTFTSGNLGQTLVYMRGVGTSVLGLAAGTSVATYVDGVYLPNQIQGLQQFSNIDRIEILRGPQATLYGRNATAGAINIITRAPSDTFHVDADISAGNYDAVTARSTVTGPLAANVSALISAIYDYHSGYEENVSLGNRPGRNRYTGVRGALSIKPTDHLIVTIRADYASADPSDYIKDQNPDSFAYTAKPVSDYLPDPRQVKNDYINDSPSHDGGISATLKADLGFANLSSVTSLRRLESGPTVTDLDSNFGPYNAATKSIALIDGDTLHSNQFFHETYLATDDTRPVFATVGAHYGSERGRQFIFRPAVAGFTGVGTAAQTYDRNLDDVDYGAFIDGGVNITGGLKATAGIRYSRDRKDYSQYNYFAFSGVSVGLLDGVRTDVAFSPRFGLEYRLDPDTLLYVSATSGFKSGGFAENDPRNTFRPEKVWSYETGIKSTVWGGRARLNGAFFYANYTDLQVQQIEPVTSIRHISNANGARIFGFDFDTRVRATDRLTVSVAGEYLNTRMGDASLCHPFLPCTGSTAPFNAGIQNPSGNPLPNAPELSLTTGIDYDIPLASGAFNAHIDVSYRSRAYFTYFGIASLPNGAPISQPAYANLNAQLSYTSQSNWSIAIYGQNLTDQLVRSWQDVISVWTSRAPLRDLGTFDTTRFGPPRTYGVRLSYNF